MDPNLPSDQQNPPVVNPPQPSQDNSTSPVTTAAPEAFRPQTVESPAVATEYAPSQPPPQDQQQPTASFNSSTSYFSQATPEPSFPAIEEKPQEYQLESPPQPTIEQAPTPPPAFETPVQQAPQQPTPVVADNNLTFTVASPAVDNNPPIAEDIAPVAQPLPEDVSPKRHKGSPAVAILTIVSFIFIGLAAFFFLQNTQLKNDLEVEKDKVKSLTSIPEPPLQPAAPQPTEEPAADLTTGWKAYPLAQLKMSFKLPSELNPTDKITPSTTNGDLRWEVLPDKPISLFATSPNSTFEGAISYLNGCIGYKKSTSGYQFVAYTKTETNMPAAFTQEHTNENSVKYLLVKSDPDQVIEGLPPSGIVEKGHIAAIINTNNTQYPALVIQMKLTPTHDEALFDQILSTFNFDEKESDNI